MAHRYLVECTIIDLNGQPHLLTEEHLLEAWAVYEQIQLMTTHRNWRDVHITRQPTDSQQENRHGRE